MAEEENSGSNDSTDVIKEKFDSLKALYSEKTKVPVPDAPIFDNISKFETVVLKGLNIKESSNEKQQKTEEPITRRFASHQEPIEAKNDERKQRYEEKNFLSKMEKILGPLSILHFYMQNKTRVKIYTRNATGVRGHIEAYVIAFDRHWNLALEDCYESWKRKIRKKIPALGNPTNQTSNTSNPESKVTVKEKTKLFETLERHIPQLLLRGEQVVLITKAV